MVNQFFYMKPRVAPILPENRFLFAVLALDIGGQFRQSLIKIRIVKNSHTLVFTRPAFKFLSALLNEALTAFEFS